MTNMRKTKIIATLGPASYSKEKIASLIEAGVDVFRFNLKHADAAWHEKGIKRVKQVAKKMNASVAVLADLQGPGMRIETKGGQEIPVKKGEKIVLSLSFSSGSLIRLSHKKFFKAAGKGDAFFIDDGLLEFVVVKKKKETVVAEALDDGVIKNRKSLNLPGKNIKLPSLVADDLKKLDMIAGIGVDFIALSFSRAKKDVETLRREMKKRRIKAGVVAKIESGEAIENIDELIEFSDAIMIARGDLGIEIPIEELAYWQKKIVKKCLVARKPVVIATQMLQSMVANQRPSRAEATDVANAVFDGTDAVMLSEETSVGKYPAKAVLAMSRILKFNEDKAAMFKIKNEPKGFTQLIMNAAMAIIENQPREKEAKINTVVVFTESGYTARVLASFRPNTNIIAVTDRKETAGYLNLSYGVTTIYSSSPLKSFKSYNELAAKLKKKKMAGKNEIILVAHGRHSEEPGLVNSIALIKVE